MPKVDDSVPNGPRLRPIAHDLGNAIGIILGNTSLLLDRLPAESIEAADAAEIEAAALTARRLIQELGALARLAEPVAAPPSPAASARDPDG